jgi:P4 family phage/plasmid primase-like protien
VNNPARLTTWPSLTNTAGTSVETTWDEWFAALAQPARFRGSLSQPGWSAGIFEPCKRLAENCVGMSALVLDYDEGYEIQSVLDHWSEWYGLLHTTRRHTPETPRFRVVLPLSRIVTPDEYTAIWQWAESVAASAGHIIDPQAKDPSRFWFTTGGDNFESHRLTGSQLLDPEPILASAQPQTLSLVPKPAPAPVHQPTHILEKRAIAYLKSCPAAISGQGGHDATWRAALAVVRGFKLDRDTAFRVLWTHYNLRCQPPWSEKELRHKVESADRDASVPWGYLADADRTPKQFMGGTGTDGPVAMATPQSSPRPSVLFKLGDHVELAAHTLRALETSPLTYDSGAHWRYVPEFGYWQLLPEEAVEATVAAFSGCWIESGEKMKPLGISAGTCQGVARIVRNTLNTRPERVQFKDAQRGIAFRNGFVTVKDGNVHIEPHSPEHLARAGLSFDYDPTLKHPRMDAFFADIFEGCSDAAERVQLIQEFIGASLLGMATEFQRCLVLFGTGSNGKSQVIDIMRSVFPDGTAVSVAPQHWEERFRLQMLVGALVNFVSEMPAKEIASSETFKGVVVGDELAAERKNKDAFNFVPIAGHMFAANKMPTASDISAGFFRRYVILPLTKVYPDSGPGVTRNIGKSIGAEERQAIAAWAVQGAARVQARGGYESPVTSIELLKEWRVESDSVAMFLNEKYEKGERSDAHSSAKVVYIEYTDWCRVCGFKPVHIAAFGKQLVSLGYRRTMVNGRARYHLIPRAEVA